MALIDKFGQYVRIKIEGMGEGGEPAGTILEDDKLRIDLDYVDAAGYGRSKISIYNLETETISAIQGGKCYASIYTRLHDTAEELLIDRQFVSNVTSETQIPNIITSLYCIDKVYRQYMQTPIKVDVEEASIKNCVKAILDAGGFKGTIEYKLFPDVELNFVPDSPEQFDGSLSYELYKYASYKKFSIYIRGDRVICMRKPDYKSIPNSPLSSPSKDDIVLDVRNLRANPKLGSGDLQIDSNLDPRIVPSSVLDVTKLLTVQVNEDTETLQTAAGFISAAISGFPRYAVFTAHHTGSNKTGDWNTSVIAYRGEKNIEQDPDKWWL